MHQRLKFTAVIVTHEVPEIFSVVEKVAMLSDGTIVAQGTPDEIKVLENPIVRRFISGGAGGTSPGGSN
jgi:phospholipid/cholesterol/gamma-HCH transport system ATP-binding protein